MYNRSYFTPNWNKINWAIFCGFGLEYDSVFYIIFIVTNLLKYPTSVEIAFISLVATFWILTPCGIEDRYQRLRGNLPLPQSSR
jgi:hypothetical protein